MQNWRESYILRWYESMCRKRLQSLYPYKKSHRAQWALRTVRYMAFYASPWSYKISLLMRAFRNEKVSQRRNSNRFTLKDSVAQTKLMNMQNVQRVTDRRMSGPKIHDWLMSIGAGPHSPSSEIIFHFLIKFTSSYFSIFQQGLQLHYEQTVGACVSQTSGENQERNGM